ncbi:MULTISPECIES: UDP-2,4-diacetamido-2,4,6-trideoxy-beta-L-altropyranose hydrolase [Bacillus cereus group]|uniref:UDP-2,4-diacetamido-2,4, 6-trideoxy-beta-L-altropyranose hydrolase n=1 Tax=Bacillus cereus TaxID=1396 RepID=A0AAN5XM80_BACCE|nr:MULTISPECIES: UDP-2,4-diacetamido-2,4,6-trideoxy-beta-L-altropyranose hydrolase [Bacillus cereus group]EJS45991.1 pseudaminic acid biosynthesis-associated protein PseG [Bacillus cereus BAG1X1-2]KAB2364609.1 UDP-2,4-diacetamido-2,4,6-trideoxy-beta-L-altropyranose hydrolase [Bacillus thuringiensis]KAB2446978.1 UDP-2,4-diacetamido-2,4,6-trideoxy-beta-L-altropyranose hydrolase [Bacillus cereus]KAB2486459.1 UDP-2,4-diacetamido-2,4,6-trideoxy-beta-L-altropyranose hydrolase [Bacillus cereus]MCU548
MLEKKIAFRADASIEIGTGHIMRCLTLAHELRNKGVQVYFICRKLQGDLHQYILNKGFHVFVLDGDGENTNFLSTENRSYLNWLKSHWFVDAQQTNGILSQLPKCDWLIVDHYGLDNKWESALRKTVRKIMVIDDLANRMHDCDLLLDQNLYDNLNDRYKDLIPEHSLVKLGPKYAILRPEFHAAKKISRKRTGKIERIFIFFGGHDVTNETLKTLRALQNINKDNLKIDVVVGSQNPHKEDIQTYCKSVTNASYYCQIENMEELLVRADLGIGAGGTTTWERCFLGLPSITITTAQNQIEVTKAVAKVGATWNIGTAESVSDKAITKCLNKLLSDFKIVKEMSNKALSIQCASNTNEIAKIILGG